MRGNKVKIRLRENKDSTTTIVLDCFMGYYVDIDGKKKAHRKRRFLDFKLIKNPRTPLEKQQNKDFFEKAKLIANNWERSIINEEYNLEDTEKGKTIVYAYLVKEIERIIDSGSQQGFKTMLSHFLKHFPRNTTFRQINKREKAKDFYDYLINKTIKVDGDNLSTKSANKYFKRLRRILMESQLEGYIQELRFDVKLLPETKPEIVYLTLEEYRTLENTDCRNSTLKNAFLFSCLTALRLGDITKLKWGEIKESIDSTGTPRIEYDKVMDKKPGGKARRINNYFDTYAKKYLGERQGDNDLVFPVMPEKASAHFNLQLHKWVLDAGINKHITFHCAKHSFAMYHIIHKEVSIFQLAKLLNHTDIRSSMHYYDLCSPELKEKLIR